MKRILVFLWLLFIPTQLGVHFWPSFAHVMGLRVDYLSPTLYFLDLIWMLMILLGGHIGPPLQWIKKWSGDHKGSPLHWIIIVFVLINILVAGNHWVAVVRWLRIFQWIVTFNLIVNHKKLFKEMLVKVLPFWIIGESLLGLGQVVNGGSLNGIFYWLGERRFSYISIGVAQISYLGQGLIRSYGTFSHPNSMAGFLLVSLVFWIKTLPLPPPLTGRGLNLKRILFWCVVFCGLLGIVLSGSRTVWAIGIALLIFNFQFSIFNLKQKLGMLMIVGGTVFLILGLINNNYRISDFVGGWDSDGMAKRGALMVASLNMIKDNPFFGVGANNFLVELPEYQRNSGVFWLQPVHNVFFLMASEFGIVGLFILYLISKKQIYKLQTNYKLQITKNKLIILGIIMVTGMVDHYWLTLPQNWWLLCIVLAIL